jgi:RNA polymerase-binding transcription factor
MSRSTVHSPSGVPPTALADAALSADHLAALRRMLEQQRAFRVDQLAQLQLPGPHGPLSSTDPEILRSLRSGARAALRDVQAALWRMEEGRYGRCVACSAVIDPVRLEVLPQTARCMRCERQDAG